MNPARAMRTKMAMHTPVPTKATSRRITAPIGTSTPTDTGLRRITITMGRTWPDAAPTLLP